MKKTTIKKFNWIAFLILPVTIVLTAVMICVLGSGLLFYPTMDYDNMTPQTESGELWKVLEVVEGEYAYVIYSVDSNYQFDDDHLIAFQGPSIEAIKDVIADSNDGAYVTSYWEGKGVKFNFSNTHDFKEYLEQVVSSNYYNSELDAEVIMANFSEVTLYDLSDYIGYERDNKSGIGLGVIILFFYVAIFTAIVLVVELLLALILKLTVFRIKKQK